jgi:hypothetical protein
MVMRSVVHVTSDAPVAGIAATDHDNEAMKNRLEFSPGRGDDALFFNDETQ